jgi:DGQHR domain-containing protein
MKNEIVFPVIKTEILGILTYRGSGKLSEISKVSRADVFDEKKNKRGTQRSLKLNHAKSAYEYVKNNPIGFWPEVVLCCRKSDVIMFESKDREIGAGLLHIDLNKIEAASKKNIIAISRVDGNHRLHFAQGDPDEELAPIEKNASFCLLMDLKLDQEIQLFRDINNNLERMPTSHLDYITVRLTPEEELKKNNPSLYIAQQLDEDKESPFFHRVSKTGKKNDERDIPLRSLKSGLQYLRSYSKELKTLSDSNVDIEYVIIKNYFLALKRWQPDAWERPREYLLLRGAGFWGACFLGGVVIDRCLSDGKWEVDDMEKLLRSGKDWDWSNKGDFAALSGRGGAVKISEKIKEQFPTKDGISIIAIREKIIAQPKIGE